MEEIDQRLKRERQREARRKRILSNASNRMDKLRGLSRSCPAGVLERIESVEPRAGELVADPPDELIPKPVHKKATDGVRNHAAVAVLVTAARSWKAFRLRTTAAVVFALALPFLTSAASLSVSYVFSMLLWEGLVLLVVMLAAPTNSSGSPLGWFGLVTMAVAQFHPSLGHLLEGVCLVLCVGSVVLQDLCTMLFFTVLALLLPELLNYYEVFAQ